MKTVFRADASNKIGGGHVMRCLALANALEELEWEIAFCVRAGTVETVPNLEKSNYPIVLLNGSEEDEANEIRQSLGAFDWLIVDHYGLDKTFERQAHSFVDRIFVIDDLANREHDCDLLLDQTYGRKKQDYQELVPDGAHLLMGTDYALLRPEFAALRPKALEWRKQNGPVRRILVSLGASDPHGVTAKALLAIKTSGLDVSVDVVIGNADPAELGLTEIAANMPQQVTFHGFDVNMAELMLNGNLAIGAGGSTSWERCCLGLPTIMIVTADNQEKIAWELMKQGYVNLLGEVAEVSERMIKDAIQHSVDNPSLLKAQSEKGMRLVSGDGTSKVVDQLIAMVEQNAT